MLIEVAVSAACRRHGLAIDRRDRWGDQRVWRGLIGVDFDFGVVVLAVIVLAGFAEVFALFFGLEAARAGFPAEAERLADFFDADVELFAAAVFVAPLLVAPLLAARLASVLERAAEPLARAAAVEAVAGDFFSVLLEGIRGLLLCCPAVETGPSLPDESRTPPAKKPLRRREGGSWKPC